MATKTTLNAKVDEVKNEIPGISGLATTSALTAVENKIPSAGNLVNKTHYDTKVNDKKITDHTHDKYITTQEFNKLKAENLAARLAQANLVTQADFDNKLSDLNRKIVSNKTKDLVIKNELKKLKTFNSSYFLGKSYFEDDGIQNYLIFQPKHRYFKIVSADNDTILSWRSKGLSSQSIKEPTAPNKLLNPSLDHVGSRIKVNFIGDCLKQERLDFRHWKIVNIYICL